MATILVVDDEAGIRGMLAVVLRRDGHRVLLAENGVSALKVLTQHDDIEVMVTDLCMPEISGLDLIDQVHRQHSEVFVVVMTAFADLATASRAMRLGAYNFIAKPFDNDRMRSLVRRAVAAREYALSAREGEGQVPVVHMVGSSQEVVQLQETIDQVATTDATILVTGPSGSGKELVARAVHYGSLRADGPLVQVNAGALSTHLLESELFGHVKGAFTGAIEDRQGLFSLANGGTIFLDEIGDIAAETQVKLLRVLENGEYFPVGGQAVQRCDVRVVAATNRDLPAMVSAGTFREDLYYRLAVIRLQLPALIDRQEDIPLLAGHLLARHAVRLRRGLTGFTEDAMKALGAYHWPGNIRELDNRIQRGAALTSDGDIDTPALFGDLAGSTTLHTSRTDVWSRLRPEEVIAAAPPPASPSTSAIIKAATSTASAALEPRQTATATVSRRRAGSELRDHLRQGGTVDLSEECDRFERSLIIAALEATEGNQTLAAKHLDLSPRQIRYRIKQLGIKLS